MTPQNFLLPGSNVANKYDLILTTEVPSKQPTERHDYHNKTLSLNNKKKLLKCYRYKRISDNTRIVR